MKTRQILILILIVLSFQSKTQNTYMVLDLKPGNIGSSINRLIVYQDNLYFKGRGVDNDLHSLWKFDGDNYPELLLPQCYTLSNLCIYNELLFFSHNSELWSYDGINPPSQEVDIIQGEGASMLSVYHDTLFFNSVHDYYGNELFFYDGTTSAELFYDIVSGVTSSSPDDYTVYNDALYFCPISGDYYLWCYNGDSPAPINGTKNMLPNHLFVYNNDLFFTGYKHHGIELWKYNSDNQTLQEFDIFPDSVLHYDSLSGTQYYIQNSSNPFGFCEFQDTLYFIARDTSNLKTTIWSYSETNSLKIARHIAVNNDEFGNLIVFDSSLFFICSDSVHGKELWKYNHSSGSQLIQDIAIGSASGHPLHLTVFKNKLYFTADDRQEFGRELWVHEPLSSKINYAANNVNILLYPNPSNEFIYYKVPELLMKKPSTIGIYNNVGEIIYKNVLLKNTGYIDVANFSSGIYYLVLTHDTGIVSNKIVIK